MKKLILAEIFLRSLLIQTSFNEKKMQNLGFTFAIYPLVRRFGADNEKKRHLIARHLMRFNTHPYLASSILGAVVNMEENSPEPFAGEEIAKLKDTLAGPYAAIGDAFFWGTLRSFASIFAVTLAFGGSMLALPAFILLYNPAHIYIRGRGFWEGYKRGRQSIEFVRGVDLPRVGGLLRHGLLVITGVLAGTAVLMLPADLAFGGSWPGRIGWFLAILFFFYWIKKGMSPITLFYLSLGVIIIITNI